MVKGIYTVIVALSLLLTAFAASAQTDRCPAEIDFVAEAQTQMDVGDFASAVPLYSCALDADPFNVDARRGRIEANLMTGTYAFGLEDYTEFLRLSYAHIPDVFDAITAHYAQALAADPDNLIALTGDSFYQWWTYNDEVTAAETARILELEPDNLYGIVFNGSALHFSGDAAAGDAQFARALELAPENPHLYWVLADAYTYATPDLERAYDAAFTAYDSGLETARVIAILATANLLMGDEPLAAMLFVHHIELTTGEAVEVEALQPGEARTLTFEPGLKFAIPIEVAAGETLMLAISSETDGVDTILALRAPDGSAFTGSDDSEGFNAGLNRVIDEAGTYTLLLSTFEGAGAGEIVLTRSSVNS